MTSAPSPAQSPIYPLAYAAKLAGLDALTARRWIKGRDYRYKGEARHSAPVVHLVRPDAAGAQDLTFEELLTLRLVRAFRETGLGLPTIRKAAEVAARRYSQANPFITRSFRSDGKSVFLELEEQGAVPGQEKVMVHALTGQQQFQQVVEPSLFEDVVFIGDKVGEWFPIGQDRSVVIRPDRSFGAPHIAGTGLRTEVVADAVMAEGGDDAAIEATAKWFGVTEAQVRDAVAAEEAWRSKKAA
jgi:uncharacterized protein (DUF433 family)